MNPEVKKMWVEALRSGKYKQGRGQLKTPSGFYCCLGVLCDLALKAGVPDTDNVFYTFNTLNQLTQAWAGLHSSNPDVAIGHTLAFINDSGSTFLEIADIIEKEL